MQKPGPESPPPAVEDRSPAPDRYLTAAEVAERLRATPIHIARLCREGKLPATMPAGTWLITEADLAAHIAARRNDRGAA